MGLAIVPATLLVVDNDIRDCSCHFTDFGFWIKHGERPVFLFNPQSRIQNQKSMGHTITLVALCRLGVSISSR